MTTLSMESKFALREFQANLPILESTSIVDQDKKPFRLLELTIPSLECSPEDQLLDLSLISTIPLPVLVEFMELILEEKRPISIFRCTKEILERVLVLLE